MSVGGKVTNDKNNNPVARSIMRSQNASVNAGTHRFQKRVQETGKYSKTVYLMATGYLLSVVVARADSGVNYKIITNNQWLDA